MKRNKRRLNGLVSQLENLIPILKAQYHVRTLEVFGSFIRGEETENSDLDLLVTFDEAPTLFRFIYLENYLSVVLNVKVDSVMKDSLKPAIGEFILAEAQLI
jgi:predicted nucleotidyltransferase